jgi:cysteinyl-tRNA synthetase
MRAWIFFAALSVILANPCPGVAAEEPHVEAQVREAKGVRRQSRGAAQAERRRLARLQRARSWGYQLRIKSLKPLRRSTFDLLVVDHGYAATRTGKKLFTRRQIVSLKRKPNGRRRPVIAYFSIGEAEQYRFYWQKAWAHAETKPAWLGPENPEWGGNFPVRYWDRDWQRIIYGSARSYLERLMAQGFDGVYLDRVDVYEEMTEERKTAEADMVAFVTALAAHARKKNPTFMVVMQNAEGLLRHREIRLAIDALGKEDLIYGIDHADSPNKQEDVDGSIALLALLQKEKRPIFAVEYVDQPERIHEIRRRYSELGLIPYFGPRNLDEIIPDPLKIKKPFDRKPTPEQVR